MEVASLGYQTDLTLLRLSGAQVEDRGDHLVVRSPYNPGHWWGNSLLLDQVPKPEASQSWLDRFTAAFPEAEHIALGFDKTDGTIADLNWFSRKGFIAEAQMVMTASKVHQPARRNTYAVYRKVCSDADWRQSVTLRLRCMRERMSQGLTADTSSQKCRPIVILLRPGTEAGSVHSLGTG
jgi:hypothetical protein